jgi:hypothetical protein
MRIFLEEMMLDGPERMETHLVAEDRLIDRVLVGQVLAVFVPWARDRDLVEHGEFHGAKVSRDPALRADDRAAPDPGRGGLDL